MDRDETIALFLQGREAWNAWAERTIAEKRTLEETGRWAAERDLTGTEQPRNEETGKWMLAVQADFSSHQFEATAPSPSALDGSLSYDKAAVYFNGFIFPGNTLFAATRFFGDASFSSAKFLGDVSFEGAVFEGECRFDLCHFSGRVTFAQAQFFKRSFFREVEFHRRAIFDRCTFEDQTSFFDATFHRSARFNGIVFADVSFRNGSFLSKAEFAQANFRGWSLFEGVNFTGYADFKKSVFLGYPDFVAIQSMRAFDLAGATFSDVPNFMQAHFDEAPRLDNLTVSGRFRPNRDVPARWRALKRIAIQGHDTDRELEFHAREVQSQRFAGHWPAPWPSFRADVWGSVLAFWFGVFYQVFSNFGRSLIRPGLFWLAAVTIGAVVYLSQSPAMIEARHKQEAKGASTISAAASSAWHAWLADRQPCYDGQSAPPKDANGDTPVYVGALSRSLQRGTDLANEAWHLAFRNAFIILDGSSEAAHRTYGCLYGVELYGGSNPLAVVPGAVSTASAIQKLFSALTIFLFGLAMRNMLKMK